MASHGYGVSLPQQHSQTPNHESFQQNSQSLAPLSTGTRHHHLVGGGGDAASPFVAHCPPPPSPPFPDQYNIGGGGSSGKSCNKKGNMHKKLKQQPRTGKGRPVGAKNKPKPPILITKMEEEALKHVIIEISAGCDIVAELIKFAQIHDVGLTVLSGSGSVTDVTLSHTFSHTPSLMTLHGTFTMLSLSGTYIKSPLSSSSSSSSLFPVAVPSSSPGYSSFSICLAGSQGQIIGGVIAGRIIAASVVVVAAAFYKKPMFHRVLNNETNSLLVDLSDVFVDHDALIRGGTNASFIGLLASFNSTAVTPQAP